VLRMKDSLVWTGGTLTDAGVLRIPVGARLTIRNASRTFTSRSIEVAGVVSWTGLGAINSGSGAALRIESGALFQLESDASWNYTLGGAIPHIDNLAGGTIKRGTATTAMVVGATLNNDGLLDIQTGSVTFTNGGNGKGTATISSGATMGFDGGTHTWSSGSSITGLGTFGVNSGVVNLGGTYNVTGLTRITGGTANFSTSDTARVTTLELSSPGVLSGVAPVVLGGTGTWTGGTLSGSGSLVIPATQTFLVTGTITKQLSGRTIATSGTMSWTGGLISGSGGVVTVLNGGALGVEAEAATWATGSTINILQGGVLKRSVGLGVAQFTAVVNNNGTIDATSGTLQLNGGGSGGGTYLASNSGASLEFGAGTHTLTAGSKINGTGLVNVTGATVSMAGTGSSFDVTGTMQVLSGSMILNTPDTARFTILQLRGGTLTGSTNMVLRGSGLWTGGSLAAPTGLPGAVYLRVPVNVPLNISGTATRSLTIRQILNFGTVNWLGGNIISTNGAVFDNQPSATLAISAAGNSWSGQGTGTNTILNRNRGNVFVTTAGSTSIGPSLFVNNLGTLDIAGGATLKLTGTFTNGTGADLQGNGTLDVAGIPFASIVNTGTVRPGGSAGILTIASATTGGGWPQGPGSTLVIDVTGPLLGTEHDQLVVTGQLTSGGALHLVGDGSFAPRTITLPLVLYGSRVGQTFSISLFNNLPVPVLLDYTATAFRVVW